MTTSSRLHVKLSLSLLPSLWMSIPPPPRNQKNLSLHPLHFQTDSTGELLEEIIEAYNEYTSSLSITRSHTLSPASITHISETELHDQTDFSLTSSSDTDIKWQNVTTRKKKSPHPKKSSHFNISKNVSNITHISKSSEGEMFPEDLSPVSSSDHQHFCKFQYFPITSNITTDSSSDSSQMFTHESITQYRPNFTIARIQFN